jgi:hypothetical protein
MLAPITAIPRRQTHLQSQSNPGPRVVMSSIQGLNFVFVSSRDFPGASSQGGNIANVLVLVGSIEPKRNHSAEVL